MLPYYSDIIDVLLTISTPSMAQLLFSSRTICSRIARELRAEGGARLADPSRKAREIPALRDVIGLSSCNHLTRWAAKGGQGRVAFPTARVPIIMSVSGIMVTGLQEIDSSESAQSDGQSRTV
jgi:hypothetical protein